MNDLNSNKKELAIALLLMLTLLAAVPVKADSSLITRNYGTVTLSGGFQAGNFPEVWDLSACDLVLGFTYDGNGLVDTSDAHAWNELGVRAVGYGNFNPTWQAEGAGVWLATDYDWTVNTFAPDPPGAPILDMDDKLILQKGGGWDESFYNLPSTPPAPWNNHRVWFDRDGVDQSQAQSPLAVDGGTYNTGGTYDIVMTLHATGATSGAAYMTVNGLNQGFETDGNWNTMELSPAGMTFTGDLAHMQVFYGMYGYGATHQIQFKDITVTGCLARYPLTISVNPSTGGTTNPAPGAYLYDWGSSVTVTATSASGYVLDYWSLDNANAGPSNPIQITMNGPHTLEARFIGPKTIKQRVLQDLTALRASITDKKDGDKLDEAIKHLTKSLEPELWVSETRLDPKHGEKVFQEEKDAVVKLLDLMKDKKSTIPDATLQGFINRLVSADRLLASGAINDAAGGDVKKIDKANEELSKGDARVADSHFTDAIEHYRNAWKHALQAV
jgi:hypothetical protein